MATPLTTDKTKQKTTQTCPLHFQRRVKGDN